MIDILQKATKIPFQTAFYKYTLWRHSTINILNYRKLFLKIILLYLGSLILAHELSLAQYNLDHQTKGTPRLTERQFLPVEEAFIFSQSIEEDRIVLKWSIAPNYYLYQDGFKFKFNKSTSYEKGIQYPIGVVKWDDFFEKELIVYYNEVEIRVPWVADEKLQLIEVHWQGCADAGLCYPPQSSQFKVDTETGTLNPDVTGIEVLATSPEPNSVVFTIIIAILGGMLLNLMPCVFPVLSIKAFALLKNQHSSRANKAHGFVYSFGVILSFVIIASIMLLLRASGEAIGWGFQLQSPVFVSSLVFLFFIMALSFAGFIEIGSRLMFLGQSSTEGTSFRSSFMTGVLATTVASPCTAPFMGPALGFAVTQPTVIALVIFGSLGLGMSLPLLVLSWVPSAYKILPKPGAWMQLIKQVLAIPLILTAIWLLWIVGRQTNIDVVASILVGITFLSLSIWLLKTTLLQNNFCKPIAYCCLLLAAVIPFNTITQQKTDPTWEKYSTQRLESLKSIKKPVFINVSADWCITCLLNEKLVLNTDTFHSTLRENNITYLKADWTNYDVEITNFLNSYQRTGVPLYVFFPGDGEDEQILNQILSPTEITTVLTKKTIP